MSLERDLKNFNDFKESDLNIFIHNPLEFYSIQDQVFE